MQQAVRRDDTIFDESASIPNRSVLQDWVMQRPLRQQGVMIIALRGPDGVAKESTAKPIVRALRACVQVNGRSGAVMRKGEDMPSDAFMQMSLFSEDEPLKWRRAVDAFYKDWDSFNVHFVQHLSHAAACIGMGHPDPYIAKCWWDFYERSAKKLHYHPETKDDINFRLRNGRRPESDE